MAVDDHPRVRLLPTPSERIMAAARLQALEVELAVAEAPLLLAVSVEI